MSATPSGSIATSSIRPARERPHRPVDDVERRGPAAAAVADDDARARDHERQPVGGLARSPARPRTSTARRCCGSPGRGRGRSRGSGRGGGRRRRRSRRAGGGAAGRARASSRLSSSIRTRAAGVDRARLLEREVEARSTRRSGHARDALERAPRGRPARARGRRRRRRRRPRGRAPPPPAARRRGARRRRRGARRAASGDGARTRQTTSRVVALDQPREQLHAEEAGRAGEQDASSLTAAARPSRGSRRRRGGSRR